MAASLDRQFLFCLQNSFLSATRSQVRLGPKWKARGKPMKLRMRDRQAKRGTRRRRHRRNRRPRFTHPERPRALPVIVQPMAVAIPPVAVTTVRIQRKHHLLVRWAHWTTIPLLLGLILSGISIYWSAPIFQHPTDATGTPIELRTSVFGCAPTCPVCITTVVLQTGFIIT